MIKQRIAIQLLVLMVMAPAMAVADNLPTPPVPHIADAPNRIPEGPARTVHFSFSATPQTVSVYELNEHVQQWYCLPGKDSAPSDSSIQSTPWPGQQASCQLEDNWGGLYKPGAPTITSGSIMFPIRGESRLVPGTLYVRVKLYWADHAGTHAKEGGWSAWHRTLVEDTHRAVFTGTKGMSVSHAPAGSLHIKVDMSGAKPPVIAAPGEAQVFHGGPINISVDVSPHAPNSVWACCEIQWKRALIVSPENNAYAQAHTPGHSAFPSSPMPWQMTSMMGFATDVKEAGSSLHGSLFYDQLRPHDHTFGYQYWFRMREDYYPGGLQEPRYPGPYSGWRSFVVQEPIQAATPYHGGMQVKPGAHMGKPSSGQQQSNHKLAPMVPMHIR